MSKRAKPEKGQEKASTPAPAKQKLFRWLSALALPVLTLLAVEVGFRVAGWGYPTHFFVPSPTGPPGTFIENSKFGWRFFPRRLARAPDPLHLSKIKPPGTCRIFVFGESAALGDPEAAYGFSRILRELLEERCPGTKFEVINTAMTAISSHVISRIARDCVPFHGDIWIVYMGNNEVIGPFGAGSVFGAKSPPLALVSAGLAAKSMRLGQVLDALWQGATARPRDLQEWEGMKMMLNEQIRADDPILRRVYEHFEYNLSEVLKIAKRAGAKAIVCSVSSNLKDCSPFADLHRPNLPEARTAEWARLFSAGAELESGKEFAQALTQYHRAAEVDNGFAALPFRAAQCSLALGDAAGAREQYVLARDLDVLRFRADTQINAIVRKVCSDYAADGVAFFDSEAVVTNTCKLGIPGSECFWDHVHFNFTGNYLLARGLADQVRSLMPAARHSSAPAEGTVLTETECAARLAYTDFDRLSVLERMWRRVHEPPFSAQLNHQALLDVWSTQREELVRATDPAGLARSAQIYRTALERRPDDWVLHHRLALLLEASGDVVGAEQHWRRVVELVPQYADAWFKLGDLAARDSQSLKAQAFYRQVLRLRPDSFEAMNGIGLVLMGQGQLEQAARFFARALRTNPKFAQAHINWGLLSSRQGMTAGAEAHYREALRCDSDSAGAHINLANLLAAQRKFPDAVDHYVAAMRLQPNDATVHLGLGNSLAALGRSSEALDQYGEAVRLNPSLAEAQFNLGVGLAKQGNLAAATACFQEAARLSPDDPQAHLDLGVALAKQSRFPEAIGEFKTVLRLDPANAAARQFLQTAEAKGPGDSSNRRPGQPRE